MKRLITSDLIHWRNKKNRKPLIMQGVRQVGKTWVLKEFGKKEFKNCYHLDFEKDKDIFVQIFKESISPKEIVINISMFLGVEINPQTDFVIFDEVQNIPRALTALKYFCEDMPELAICASGSLLGVFLSNESYPVGKVEYLTLYPFSFEEFLLNYGNDKLYGFYKKGIEEKKNTQFVHNKLIHILREYYVTGGMPEVLNYYFENKDKKTNIYNDLRKIQNNLLVSYMEDINKHCEGVNALHVDSVFNNIPMQLAETLDGSVKRFKFKGVIPGRKGYAELQSPINWLLKSGLIIKVQICDRAELPFKAFAKDNLFKLYIFDVGILGAMLELSPALILLGDYAITKGFFIENYVVIERNNISENNLYSWTERNSEIELMTEKNGEFVPVEVKSGLRTKAKSLAQFIKKYSPNNALILSEKPLANINEVRKNIPLYYSASIDNFVNG